jgi:hypothetical protein
MNSNQLNKAIREGIARGVGVVGLAGVALIHLLDLPGKFSETPYMGWMYVGLMVSSVALAGALIRSGDRRIWAGTAALMVAVLTGYTLSRTTGLPQSTDDIGNWGEPLGIASLFVEGALVLLSGTMLAARRTMTAAVAAPRSQRPRSLVEVA